MKIIIEAEISDTKVKKLEEMGYDVNYPFSTNVTLDYGNRVIDGDGKIAVSNMDKMYNTDSNTSMSEDNVHMTLKELMEYEDTLYSLQQEYEGKLNKMYGESDSTNEKRKLTIILNLIVEERQKVNRQKHKLISCSIKIR